MKSNIRLFLFIYAMVFVNSKVLAQNCDCLANFDYLVSKVKKNYVGYKDKVRPDTQKEFDQLTAHLRSQAKLMGTKNCIPVLKPWVDFFKDNHLAVYLDDSKATPAQLKVLFATTEKIKLTEVQVRQYLKNSKDALEGIWEDDFQSYQVAIIHNKTPKRDYVGFVIRSSSSLWSIGQVKLEIKKKADSLKINFYGRDHVSNYSVVRYNGSSLEIPNFGKWIKLYPGKAGVQEAYVPPTFEFKKLDAQTNLLVLPSFVPDYKPIIDSLIESNRSALLSTPNLIIDVRDNVGGSNSSYEKLSPFIYTTPVITESYSTLATPDNIEMYKKTLDSTNKQYFELISGNIKLMEKNINKWIPQYPADTIKFDSVYRYPAKVAILMNEYSGSSTEFLLLEASGSSKVTLYGKPSMGAIDYVDYLMDNSLPCTLYQYHYPTTRLDALDKNPGKEYVIKPDVEIPVGTKDWVQYVRSQLVKQ